MELLERQHQPGRRRSQEPGVHSENDPPFPTILMAGNQNESFNAFVRSLEQEGYLVLVAGSGPEALRIAKTHSRPIQLLLVNEALAASPLFNELRPYESGIRLLVIAAFTETSLARVRKALEAPEKGAAAYA